MKEIQGYLCIIPNNPDGRGTLHFSEQSAIDAKTRMDEMVSTKWPSSFNLEYWKEKPLPCEIYPLTCCKNTTN